jgi:hypothetical protein
MQKEELIRALTEDCAPVRPLAHPVWRALLWFAVSLCYVSVVVAGMRLRPDLAAKLTDSQYSVEVAAGFLTSVTAAAGAFCSGSPGRPPWERFAPLPFLLIWIGALGVGCWRDLSAFGLSGLVSHSDFECLPTIFAISVPIALLILAMVRRGAPVAPFLTIGQAALAATALAASGLRLSFKQDAEVSVCIWQFGAVLLLTGIATLFGRLLLRWTTRDAFLTAHRRLRRAVSERGSGR